ncbi:MAG: glycosyltransferase family 39 protein, partial [Anaerolineales bacterium]
MDSSRKLWLLALLLVALGMIVRMVDLQDPPVDFHPTRQFRGALIARDIYYRLLPDADPQKQALASELSAGLEEFEPPVLDFVVALGYLALGGEALWLARLIVSLAWCLGGLALFALVKRSVSEVPALVALAYYLFFPFGIIASRSFQPDPLMTVILILVMLAAYRWSSTLSWRWAVLTGLFSAAAILLKVVAAFLVAGLLIALVLKVLGFRSALKNAQVWVMAVLMILLPGLYYLIGIGDSSSNYFQNWVLAMLPLVTTPDFYVGWLKRLVAFRALPMLAAL